MGFSASTPTAVPGGRPLQPISCKAETSRRTPAKVIITEAQLIGPDCRVFMAFTLKALSACWDVSNSLKPVSSPSQCESSEIIISSCSPQSPRLLLHGNALTRPTEGGYPLQIIHPEQVSLDAFRQVVEPGPVCGWGPNQMRSAGNVQPTSWNLIHLSSPVANE